MGGGKSQTSTQQVSIPPEVLARYNSVNATAQQAANTPFQAYSQDPNAFVAPLNQVQQAGIGQVAGAANMAQPYMGAATGYELAGAGPANLGALNTNQYMSPFLSNVYGATLAGENQQNAQARSAMQGQAIQAGAFGGDRANTAQANLAYQQNLANAQTNANLLNTGYTQAQNVAQQQQGAQLSAEQQNLARLSAAGQGLAGIGAQAQTLAQQGGANALQAGTVPQQTQQAGLTALYNQYLQQQAYPFQTAQFLAGVAEGTGALSGSTTTTTAPGSIFSDERLKDGKQVIGETFDGQPIYKYRYKGDHHTQIGLMAQDVERHHPEAVGESQGYKTVDYDEATRHAAHRGHFYQGGLVPNHMGGVVHEGHMGEEYARGGFADGGASIVDATDLKALLAAQQNMYGQSNLYNTARGTVPGSGNGLIPNASGSAPKLVTAGQLKAPGPSDIQQAVGGLSTMNSTADTASGLWNKGVAVKNWATTPSEPPHVSAPESSSIPAKTEAPAPSSGGPDTSTTDAQGSTNWEQPYDTGMNRGGLVPRHHYAVGGGMPYASSEDPSGYMTGIDTEDTNKTPEQLKAEQAGLSSGKGLPKQNNDALQAVQTANSLYGGSKLAGKGYDLATKAIGKDAAIGTNPTAYETPIGPGMENMPGGVVPSAGTAGAPGAASAAAPTAEAGGLSAAAPAAATPMAEATAADVAGADATAAGTAAATGAADTAATAGTAALTDAAATAGTAAVADAGASAADILPFLMLANRGGVVPREHHSKGDVVGDTNAGLLPLDTTDQAPDKTPAPVAAAPTGGVVPAATTDELSAESQPENKVSDEDLHAIADRTLGIQKARESAGNANAQSATSSASGLYGLTDGTAKDILTRYPIPGFNFDPTANYPKGFAKTLPTDVQEQMAHNLAYDHAKTLINNGLEPSPGNMSANWFFGSKGGPAFLKTMQQNPDAPATAAASPEAVAANQKIFFDDAGKPRSVSDVYSLLNSKQSPSTSSSIADRVASGLGAAGRTVSNLFSPSEANAQTAQGGLGGAQEGGTNWEKILVPALAGLGGMASSNSRYLGAAILQGLGAGAGAYENVLANQTNRAKVGAETGTQEATTQAMQQNMMSGDIRKNAAGALEVLIKSPSGAPVWVPYGQWVQAKQPATFHQGNLAANPVVDKLKELTSTPAPATTTQENTTTAQTNAPASQANAPAAQPNAPAITPTVGLTPGMKSLADQNALTAQNFGTDELAKQPSVNDPFTPASQRAAEVRNNMKQTITSAHALGDMKVGGPISSEMIYPIVSKVNNAINILNNVADPTGTKKVIEPIQPGVIASKELSDKINTLAASSLLQQAGGKAFGEMQAFKQAVPSDFNSKEGQAKLVSTMLTTMQMPLDEDSVYNQHRQYVESKYGLTPGQSQFTGRGLQQEFMKNELPVINNEQSMIEHMFLHPFINTKTGEPAKISRDVNGQPIAPTMLNHLIETNGNLSPATYKALVNKFSQPSVDNVLRYFKGQ